MSWSAEGRGNSSAKALSTVSSSFKHMCLRKRGKKVSVVVGEGWGKRVQIEAGVGPDHAGTYRLQARSTHARDM